MGKIFGISNLPISTIDKALTQQLIEKPIIKSVRIPRLTTSKANKADVYVKTTNRKPSITHK